MYLNELLREEQHLSTQNIMDQKDTANVLDSAYVAPAKPRNRDLSKTQCYSCKEYGHLAYQCKKKVCNYCKKPGHLIFECRKRLQNRSNAVAYHASTESFFTNIKAHAHVMSFDDVISPRPPSNLALPTLTLEMVQQMIHSTFFALGLTGKKFNSSIWYVDYGASNHMTCLSKHIVDTKKYDGHLDIQTASVDKFPISAIGNIPHSLPFYIKFSSLLIWPLFFYT